MSLHKIQQKQPVSTSPVAWLLCRSVVIILQDKTSK